MFIQKNKMDESLYKIQKEQSSGIQELEQSGAEKSPIWPDTVSDLWAGMFKYEPKLEENATGPLAGALQEVMETKEWKNLRHVTKLDEFNSAVGTVSFGREFLKNLPDEVLKAQEAVQEEERIQNALGKIEDSLEYPEELKEQLRELAEQATNTSNIAMAKANSACEGDIGQAVRIVARQAAENATGETLEAKEFASAWGNGAGDGKKLSLAGQLALSQKIKENQTMKLFASMIGRMKRLAQGYQAKKIEKRPEEIIDIEVGNNLNSVLPAEFARLGDPLAKIDFLRRYSEKGLLQFKKVGTDKAGRGPIVLMIDESGSMSGKRIAWAKAVGMGLCWIAQKQKRSIIIGGFSSGGQIWTKEFLDGKISVPEMEWFAEQFYGGGTDFEMALRKCVHSILECKMPDFRKADIVFISDGACYIRDDFRRTFICDKKRLGIRVLSVGIGCGTDSFEDFSDAAFTFNGNIEKDEKALERIFSI